MSISTWQFYDNTLTWVQTYENCMIIHLHEENTWQFYDNTLTWVKTHDNFMIIHLHEYKHMIIL